jgi:hypothetical protein
MEMLAYLDLMSKYILSPAVRKCERNGVDQGIHNVIVHVDPIPRLHMLSHKDGLIANLQGKDSVIKYNEGKVYNKNHQVVAIVHQYDRDEKLMAKYVDEFVDYPPPPPVKGTGQCDKFMVYEDVELYKGLCDLTGNKAKTPQDCCAACLGMKKCKGWSVAGHHCFLKNCNNPDPKKKLRIPGTICGTMGVSE